MIGDNWTAGRWVGLCEQSVLTSTNGRLEIYSSCLSVLYIMVYTTRYILLETKRNKKYVKKNGTVSVMSVAKRVPIINQMAAQ